MKKIKINFLIIGFLAGIVYTAACSSGAKSIANAISTALDVSFDNSTSGMTSTTAQAAINELDSRIDLLENKVRSLAKTNVRESLIGTWTGIEFNSTSEARDHGFLANHQDFTITFNDDGTYICANTTELEHACPSGTWTQQGLYVRLANPSNTQRYNIGNPYVLIIGAISETSLLLNTDDTPDTFGIWSLSKQ